jgi:NTP pyrophosphatase (non-canonical NTP hydrolase)
MNYEELQEKVNQWAAEKGILDKATALTQLGKTQEELDETRAALILLDSAQGDRNKQIIKSEALAEIEDGIGDMMVTIIILSKLVGFDSVKCLETAYNVIKKRTGKMENGVFVKDDE